MHTDLSPHLHTTQCNQLINKLQECHKENKFAKFIGACNSIDSALTKCLKQERVERSANNRAKALQKHAELRRRLSQNQ